MSATTQVRALLSAVSAGPDPAALVARQAPGLGFPLLRVGGRELCREETAAALFEAETDCFGLHLSTDALYGIARDQVGALSREGFDEIAEIFSGLDSGEFFEVGACRWYAYRLHLSFWYFDARTRPMTTGEAAAALYLSDWQRTAGGPVTDPRTIARQVRQGAARVPTSVLTTLGAALTGELARTGPQVRVWLHGGLLPDYRRRRTCFHLLAARPRIATPTIVRPDSGGYLVGAIPPAGPGNRWARSLRPEW